MGHDIKELQWILQWLLQEDSEDHNEDLECLIKTQAGDELQEQDQGEEVLGRRPPHRESGERHRKGRGGRKFP